MNALALAQLPFTRSEPFATDADVWSAIDEAFAEPEPCEQPSTLPPPPTTRTRQTVRPGAKETR